MEFLGALFNFFLDPLVKQRNKFILPLCILVIAVLLNDITGYVFYYSRGKKVEQISRITEALNDTIPEDLMREMMYLRNEILERHSTISYLFSRIGIGDIGNANKNYLCINARSIEDKNAITQNNRYIIPDTMSAKTPPYAKDSIIASNHEVCPSSRSIISSMTKIHPHNASNDINRMSFFISSSGIYFLLFIWICVLVFSGRILEYDEITKKGVDNRKLNTVSSKLIICAMALSIFILLSLLSYTILGSIFSSPILGKWWITYSIVGILSLLLPLFLFYPVVLRPNGTQTEKQQHGILFYESNFNKNK